MEKVISKVEIVGSNVMELQAALTKLLGNARIAANGQDWGGGTCVDIEDQNGEELSSLELIEETLSDKSKAYNVRLRFSNVE
jgi:hypothetical protein